jgi:hypothetical protein
MVVSVALKMLVPVAAAMMTASMQVSDRGGGVE